MSIDSKITVSGWVGTQPRHVVTQNGTSFTVFRLGSTKRYFDRSQESWVDGATTWFTVKTWRSAAVNVAESLRRSDPVVVHGALSTEVWESPDGPRTTLVIEADALGPDLTRGQATFRHTVHQAGGEVVTQTGAEGSASTPPGGSPLDPPLTPRRVRGGPVARRREPCAGRQVGGGALRDGPGRERVGWGVEHPAGSLDPVVSSRPRTSRASSAGLRSCGERRASPRTARERTRSCARRA
jgi:single-strand DNA-binding protein